MLDVAHHPWSEPLRRPRMSNDEDVRAGVSLTSRYLIRHGRPVIPVSGEIHYSRIPRARWRQPGTNDSRHPAASGRPVVNEG